MMQEAIQRHGEQGRIAAKRAFAKTLKWFRGQATRYASKELDIPRKALRSRWFMDNAAYTLWLGLNPVAAHLMGNARQTKTGVRASIYNFDGAFLAQMNGKSDLLVMRRIGRRRLPISKEFVDISDKMTIVFNRFKRLAISRFEVIFKQELNYVRNHEKFK